MQINQRLAADSQHQHSHTLIRTKLHIPLLTVRFGTAPRISASSLAKTSDSGMWLRVNRESLPKGPFPFESFQTFPSVDTACARMAWRHLNGIPLFIAGRAASDILAPEIRSDRALSSSQSESPDLHLVLNLCSWTSGVASHPLTTDTTRVSQSQAPAARLVPPGHPGTTADSVTRAPVPRVAKAHSQGSELPHETTNDAQPVAQTLVALTLCRCSSPQLQPEENTDAL